jgi:hypothetical protein
MNVLIRAAGLVAVVAALSQPLQAQWPLHPTPGVPRLPNGEPNWDAPAPRTADGKPDLGGVWRAVAAQAPGRQGGAGPVQPPAPVIQPPSPVPVAGFRDVGANVPGGLSLTPAGAALLKKHMDGKSEDNPEAHCLPMGIIQFHTQGAPRKFIHNAGLLVILYEASMGMRQIFLDGRKPPTSDAQPWWYGYSLGRWDGDTLVVETTHLRDDGWLDIIGNPLTDAATLTERIRRVSYGRMEIDITVEDPKAYTKPWTVRVNQQLMVDEDLIEFICLENQRFTAQ